MRRSCRRLSAVMPVRLCCRVTKRPVLHGEVVEKDDGKNDPADGEEAVARAVGGGSEGEAHGHVKDDDGGEKCGDETCDGGDVGLEAQDGHGAEENDDGQARR